MSGSRHTGNRAPLVRVAGSMVVPSVPLGPAPDFPAGQNEAPGAGYSPDQFTLSKGLPYYDSNTYDANVVLPQLPASGVTPVGLTTKEVDVGVRLTPYYMYPGKTGMAVLYLVGYEAGWPGAITPLDWVGNPGLYTAGGGFMDISLTFGNGISCGLSSDAHGFTYDIDDWNAMKTPVVFWATAPGFSFPDYTDRSKVFLNWADLVGEVQLSITVEPTRITFQGPGDHGVSCSYDFPLDVGVENVLQPSARLGSKDRESYKGTLTGFWVGALGQARPRPPGSPPLPYTWQGGLSAGRTEDWHDVGGGAMLHVDSSLPNYYNADPPHDSVVGVRSDKPTGTGLLTSTDSSQTPNFDIEMATDFGGSAGPIKRIEAVNPNFPLTDGNNALAQPGYHFYTLGREYVGRVALLNPEHYDGSAENPLYGYAPTPADIAAGPADLTPHSWPPWASGTDPGNSQHGRASWWYFEHIYPGETDQQRLARVKDFQNPYGPNTIGDIVQVKRYWERADAGLASDIPRLVSEFGSVDGIYGLGDQYTQLEPRNWMRYNPEVETLPSTCWTDGLFMWNGKAWVALHLWVGPDPTTFKWHRWTRFTPPVFTENAKYEDIGPLDPPSDWADYESAYYTGTQTSIAIGTGISKAYTPARRFSTDGIPDTFYAFNWTKGGSFRDGFGARIHLTGWQKLRQQGGTMGVTIGMSGATRGLCFWLNPFDYEGFGGFTLRPKDIRFCGMDFPPERLMREPRVFHSSKGYPPSYHAYPLERPVRGTDVWMSARQSEAVWQFRRAQAVTGEKLAPPTVEGFYFFGPPTDELFAYNDTAVGCYRRDVQGDIPLTWGTIEETQVMSGNLAASGIYNRYDRITIPSSGGLYPDGGSFWLPVIPDNFWLDIWREGNRFWVTVWAADPDGTPPAAGQPFSVGDALLTTYPDFWDRATHIGGNRWPDIVTNSDGSRHLSGPPLDPRIIYSSPCLVDLTDTEWVDGTSWPFGVVMNYSSQWPGETASDGHPVSLAGGIGLGKIRVENLATSEVVASSGA